MKTKTNSSKKRLNFLEIPDLGIKVSIEISKKMTYLEAKKYCKKFGAKMLNYFELEYILDNRLIKNFGKKREFFKEIKGECHKCAVSLKYGDNADNPTICFDNEKEHRGVVRIVLPIDNKNN